MCKKKFHRYGNFQILDPNINEEKCIIYVKDYILKMARKKRKGLKLIRVYRPNELDFYYHINKKINKSNYYRCDIWYRYKGDRRTIGFNIPLTTF